MTSSVLTCSLPALAVAFGLALSTSAFAQNSAKSDTAQAQNTSSQVTKQHVDGGDGPVANTFFTQLPGVVAQPPQQSAPAQR